MTPTATPGVELVLDARATIGESPFWSSADGCLYWTDICAPALYRYDPRTGQNRHWPLPAEIGAFALLPDCRAALVALRSGLYELNLLAGNLTWLAEPRFDPRHFRFNEGGCDPQGRFWIGVMLDPEDPGSALEAPLHCYTRRDGLRTEHHYSQLHNGLAWSLDGGAMYLADSNAGAIMVQDFNRSNGSLGHRRVFAHVAAAEGVPDGAAVDDEGCYWCAIHGGGQIRRYHPDGARDRVIRLPVSQPTMCAFGGPGMDELYITTARQKLDQAKLAAEPFAGGLFRFRPGVKGPQRPYFG